MKFYGEPEICQNTSPGEVSIATEGTSLSPTESQAQATEDGEEPPLLHAKRTLYAD